MRDEYVPDPDSMYEDRYHIEDPFLPYDDEDECEEDEDGESY